MKPFLTRNVTFGLMVGSFTEWTYLVVVGMSTGL